jgi:hypothetical protein
MSIFASTSARRSTLTSVSANTLPRIAVGSVPGKIRRLVSGDMSRVRARGAGERGDGHRCPHRRRTLTVSVSRFCTARRVNHWAQTQSEESHALTHACHQSTVRGQPSQVPRLASRSVPEPSPPSSRKAQLTSTANTVRESRRPDLECGPMLRSTHLRGAGHIE